MISRIASFSLLLLLAVGSITAQSASSSASTEKTSKKSAIEQKREQKRYLAMRAEMAKRLTPSAIKRAQQAKTVVLPMEFLGQSESMLALAKQKLPPVPKENGPTDEGEERREESMRILKSLARPSLTGGPVVESFLQTEVLAPSAAVAGANFEGPGSGIAGFTILGAPPDTTMAVGPNHIIAWVNSQYMVFNKSGAALLPAPGFVTGNTLFAGLPAGTLCKDYNRGDPILQYDRLANRWILSQFAFDNTNSQNAQCFAVSTTSDPLGTYYLYQVNFGANLPDYGKLGIWNDAYYTSYNMFGPSSFVGLALCASDRTKMLAGDPAATTLCSPNLANFYSFLPADLDGTALPSDTTRGGIFLGWNWYNVPAPPYTMQIVRLKPNFATSTVTVNNGFGGASNSTINITVSGIAPCNDGSGGFACVAQPATTRKLDTLGDRHMYRLAYRNRGGVDSLVVTQSVDPDGSGARSSALRWYEIRNPLGDPNAAATKPFVYQSGTYDPGASNDRWMGSVAMNKYGDIMAGYSVANAGTGLRPSIAVAGRAQGDALGTLQAEQIALTGTGSQTATTHTRWGDYTTIQVDPADDQTFWYIGEYLAVDGAFVWRTRIVSYKFATTTATTNGDFNTSGNWSNGVPSATVSGIVPAGQTMTVNTPTTVYNLDVQSGGSVTMNADLTVQGSLTLGNSISTGANTLGIGCLGTVSGASSSAYVIGNVKKDFCSTDSFTFPTGSANGYAPVTSTVTALPTNPSSLSVRTVQGSRAGMNSANSLQRYWTLALTGNLTTDLVFSYLDPTDISGTESGYKLYRWSGSTSTAVNPFTLNTTANTMTASGITSFSDWAIGNLAPTAAGVSVSGRILTSGRNGIRNAVVTLTDQAGITRSAITSAFGYYRFDDIAAGQTVVISVASKRYQFEPRAVDVSDNVIDLDLIAQ